MNEVVGRGGAFVAGDPNEEAATARGMAKDLNCKMSPRTT
jgi:hypothetical protein